MHKFLFGFMYVSTVSFLDLVSLCYVKLLFTVVTAYNLQVCN